MFILKMVSWWNFVAKIGHGALLFGSCVDSHVYGMVLVSLNDSWCNLVGRGV